MKKILMILAEKEFRDLEYIVPKAFFKESNFEVFTTSTSLLSTGRFGFEVYHESTIKNYKDEYFNALVFVGGAGSLDLGENEDLKKITKKHLESGALVASICASPYIIMPKTIPACTSIYALGESTIGNILCANQ